MASSLDLNPSPKALIQKGRLLAEGGTHARKTGDEPEVERLGSRRGGTRVKGGAQPGSLEKVRVIAKHAIANR